MAKGSLGLDEKLEAVLIYIPMLTLIMTIIVLILENTSYYCLFHAWQALFLVVAYIIVQIIFIIIGAATGVSLFWIAWIIFWIIWIILAIFAWTRAESGNPLSLPLIGGFAKTQAEKKIAASGNSTPKPDIENARGT
eukprot:TRINITY_DN4027_c0_g1_i1.p1 TRINITY_DN4027_c0_g1~~TRINITY_DN4027_c0_g1_i1.p1  ORF type:complete len:137 (-),score=31.68 TRINITY_DN4027_c0_g1_i1:30-440(-)